MVSFGPKCFLEGELQSQLIKICFYFHKIAFKVGYRPVSHPSGFPSPRKSKFHAEASHLYRLAPPSTGNPSESMNFSF